MIIDATDLVLGRMATFVAKKAMAGEEVHIVNVEKAVITGEPSMILAKYKKDRNRGAPLLGPYYPRTAEQLVKRTIRGMLPKDNTRGREALKKVKCYSGIPESVKADKAENMDSMKIHSRNVKFTTIREISKQLGARVE